LHRRVAAGFTLLEVMVASAVFILSTLGFTYSYQMLNTRAARARCDAAAQAILRAKVAKVLTDPWLPPVVTTPSVPQTIPTDCVVNSGSLPTTADSNDPYDVGPTVILQSQSGSPQVGLVTGTLYRYTYVFESAPKTVVIDYTLTYVYRGASYSCYASTIRAEDK